MNGKRLVLTGVCRHEFLASHPFSPPEAAVERDLALIKHAGFNFANGRGNGIWRYTTFLRKRGLRVKEPDGLHRNVGGRSA